MKIGVVSDTHGYLDPQLPDLLAGVDAILHAGDVGSRTLLDELEHVARVRVVRGNVDPAELNLPPSVKVQFGAVQIEMQHQLPVAQSDMEKWADGSVPQGSLPEQRARFLKSLDPATKVVVFGHSHQPCLLAFGGRLFFNPGSAGKRRFSLPRCFGLLELFPHGLRGSIIGLEREKQSLPGSIGLPLED